MHEIFSLGLDEPKKSKSISDDDDFAKPKSAQTTTKQEEVRKVSGYKSIGDVANAAPSSYGDVKTSPAAARRIAAAATKRETKEEIAAREKEERKQKAIATIGARYCKLLATTPYSMWAKFARDQFFELTPEEAKELSDAYFELAQALQPDLTSPWVIGFGIMVQNGMLIAPRLRYMKEQEAKAALAAAEEERKQAEAIKNN